MILQLVNWRTFLLLVAITIVGGTIFYANYLAQKISADERKKITIWVAAQKLKATSVHDESLPLTQLISQENTDIPIIETDENDNPSGQTINLDTTLINGAFLKDKVKAFKSINKPIELVLSDTPKLVNKYYYGESALLNQVRWYPRVQVIIVAIFVVFLIVMLYVRNTATQNLVWAGMAKEAAHQLGTPITSLQGWVEILKADAATQKYAPEMEKDVDRLKLVSDRFGKIGSTPQLEITDIIAQVNLMVDYIKKRAPQKVTFNVITQAPTINLPINAHLFDWVIENLLKNALDAMNGAGTITVTITDAITETHIDIADSGKGIPKANWGNIFKPGFTTKKRGWGLGLSLSKRIIEQYHKGVLFLKNSEPDKGTTFRVTLKK
jgi:hypothetical protein